jgi:hypothetical protein
MPFDLKLSKILRAAGWKVKVFDREGPETPHVTVICKTKTWRISLRTGSFLFPGGKNSELPDELLETIQEAENWAKMIEYWDEKNPKNPVEGKNDE